MFRLSGDAVPSPSGTFESAGCRNAFIHTIDSADTYGDAVGYIVRVPPTTRTAPTSV